MVANAKAKPSYKASMPEIQRHACESIEEFISWHTCGISAMSKETGFPDVGSAVPIRWGKRTFLVTAGHAVDAFTNEELDFVFRPPGSLERALWYQSATPTKRLLRGERLPIIRRFRSKNDDIAALEVSPDLEATNGFRFYTLDANTKIVRPIPTSICAIGLPFDSYERLGPQAAAFSMFALWGNVVRPGKRVLHKFNPRKSLLVEFLPAKDGRKPGGYSGAGAWYQTPTATPLIVWTPASRPAGLITAYYAKRQVLEVCRIERVVAFLKCVAGPVL
jgi:hypothetical protein